MLSEPNYLVQSVEAAAEKAIDAGFEVIYGDDWHLLLDYDAPSENYTVKEPPPQFNVIMKLLNDNGFYCHIETHWQSKSGGLHVLVRLDSSPLAPLARIALQAAMGSDPKREALGVLRVLAGVVEPCMLFRPPTRKFDADEIPF
jgi:hypothetical protein